jgi:hypothetical protein
MTVAWWTFSSEAMTARHSRGSMPSAVWHTSFDL